MPAPSSSKALVVRCKGCERHIPCSVGARATSIVVRCPVCRQQRAYVTSTEIFAGRPSWEVMRALQGRL